MRLVVDHTSVQFKISLMFTRHSQVIEIPKVLFLEKSKSIFISKIFLYPLISSTLVGRLVE